MALFFGFIFVSGCTSSRAGAPPGERTKIRASVFTNMVHLVSTDINPGKPIFLAFEPGEAPAWKPLWADKLVKSSADCKVVPPLVVDKETGQSGKLIEIKSISIEQNNAEAKRLRKSNLTLLHGSGTFAAGGHKCVHLELLDGNLFLTVCKERTIRLCAIVYRPWGRLLVGIRWRLFPSGLTSAGKPFTIGWSVSPAAGFLPKLWLTLPNRGVLRDGSGSLTAFSSHPFGIHPGFRATRATTGQ